jgi:predicted methyltransferase
LKRTAKKARKVLPACIGLAMLPAIALAAPNLSSVIASAVADPSRPTSSTAADADRKPAETLLFSGIRPGMVVGEFYPSGGYFTRMLSDVVGPEGHVYGIENQGWKGNLQSDEAILKDLKWKNVSFQNRPFGTVDFPARLDLAWVSQNYHDLKVPKFGGVDTLKFDREVYAGLKPGGIFFVLDHQGPPGLTDADIPKLHRIDRAEVIREVTAAGFKLAAEGNFLRRPDDKHTLPIFDETIKGHTDQFALKFVKPQT